MNDPAIKAVYAAHARELWDVLSRGTKASIRAGVVPAGVLLQEQTMGGYDPHHLTVALLELGNATR